MALPLAAAIIPAAASLAGSAINSLTGSAANRANVAMQRETNEMNYRMFKEQNAWNLAQWNRENVYNSPEQQALRLQRAGINPAYVFGNGSVSEASALQSASPNPAQSPHVEPINVGSQIAEGAYTAVNAYMQSQLQNASIDEIRTRTAGQSIQNDLDLATLVNKIKVSNLDAKEKDFWLDYIKRTQEGRVAFENGKQREQQAQTDYLKQQTAYLKCKQVLESFQTASNIRLNNAQVDAISNSIAQNWQQIAIAWQHLDVSKMSVQAQNAYLGNLVIKMANDTGFDWEKLGISKDMVTSEKFRNYVGSAASAVVAVMSAVGVGKMAGKYAGFSQGLSPAASAWPLNGYAGYSVP